MHKQGYEYSLGMMTVIFLADVKTAGLTADAIFKEENGRNVVNDGLYIVLLDGLHQYAGIYPFHKNDEHLWTLCRISKNLILSQDGVRAM